MYIDINLVENLEVEGIDTSDYPDFCDAYFSAGNWIKTGFELKEHELIALGDKYPEKLSEMAYQSLI